MLWNLDLLEVQKIGLGLEYVILESGDEVGVSFEGGDNVVVYYEGCFNEGGGVFDSVFQCGEVVMFLVNWVILGWVEVLQLMKFGDCWLVYVLGNFVYGLCGNGLILLNVVFNFEVELMDIVLVK